MPMQGNYLNKEEECEVNFTRERLVIIYFRVKLMTLHKFSSDHEPSKSLFDQSPPHPVITAGE
jgi:hypothetical protein